MSRVDFLRDLGLDVETAVVLDDELLRLPKRTQRVFRMRASGFNMEEITPMVKASMGTVYNDICVVNKVLQKLKILPQNRTYNNRGSDGN